MFVMLLTYSIFQLQCKNNLLLKMFNFKCYFQKEYDTPNLKFRPGIGNHLTIW